MTTKTLRAGILGAGYISEFHLKAIERQSNVDLVAVCDLDERAAKALASKAFGTRVYTNLDAMLRKDQFDVVHVLTQPDSHFSLAKKVLEAGHNVILEKPVTVDSCEAEKLAAIAKERNLSLAVNHNFVFSRPFNALQRALDGGEIGPIKSVRVVWKKVLPQMNFGPWNLWMLRDPGNIIFEVGSHTISELLGVVHEIPKIVRTAARLPKVLPSGSVFFRRWNITAELGPIAIEIDTSFDQGYDQHLIEVEGMFGVARADIENDIFTIDQPTGHVYDSERFHVNFKVGSARIKQAFNTYASYAASKVFPSVNGSPYETSMLAGIVNCYEEIFNRPERRESGIEFAINIAKTAEAILAEMPKTESIIEKDLPGIPNSVSEPGVDAKILIVGASGYIGKRLLNGLQGMERGVRALVRDASKLSDVSFNENSEVMVGDFRDTQVIEKALQGIDTVFHLAVAHSNSLEGYLKLDSKPTLRLAALCEKLGVRRFIYTGTIDSLDLARPGKIVESDGVDSKIARRNNYARSKAITESKLNAMYLKSRFPVVIIRPAIVLGAGGPVDHLGIAKWFGLGRCTYWGNGRNLIPAILADDVVNGLIAAMDAKGIEGKVYNLSADPCISARNYISEVEKVLGSKIITDTSSAAGHFFGDLLKWPMKVLARHPDRARIPSLKDWKCREQHASFDTTRAQTDLSWSPTNDREMIIEKGIREPTRLYLDG